MAQGWKEHHASVVVNAPIHQVYALFSHFNDFPKFMHFVKEVTYYDDQRSHWVADVVGRHEWDAQNENWVENRQIGWRSYNGMENAGRVTFQTVGPMQTQVDVYVTYNPPAGVAGDVGESLGAGARFEQALQHDLDNFARMVDQAPEGALDPNSSNYLFHSDSAAATGTTTSRQNATMQGDQTSTYTDTTNRPVMDQDIIAEPTNTVTSGVTSTSGNPFPTESETPDANVFPPDRGTTTGY